MHVYYLFVFSVPAGVTAVIDRLLRAFMCGSNEKQRKIHGVKWELVRMPNIQGGLGVRKGREINCALLGKWVWKLPGIPIVCGSESLSKNI